jgi:hypothetical protein
MGRRNISDASSADYLRRILSAYEGEIYGEALFGDLARSIEPAANRLKMEALAALEAETRRRLAPLVQRYAIDVADETPQIEKGRLLAAEMKALGWTALIERLGRIVEPAVDRYDALAEAARPEDRDALDYLAWHERALLDFVAAEREERAGSLDSVHALLGHS